MNWKKTKPRLRIILVWIAGVIGLVIVLFCVFWVHPLWLELGQVSDGIIHNGIGYCVQKIQSNEGAYPATYQRATFTRCNPAFKPPPGSSVEMLDIWDHPIYYKGSETAFLLVGFGRDGQPDHDNYDDFEYWTRLAPPDVQIKICGRPDADLVRTQLGIHTMCGK